MLLFQEAFVGVLYCCCVCSEGDGKALELFVLEEKLPSSLHCNVKLLDVCITTALDVKDP